MISPLTLGLLGPKWLPEPSWGGAEQSCAAGGGPRPSATSMLCVSAATQTTPASLLCQGTLSCLLEKTYSPFRRAGETTSGLVHAHHLVAWAACEGPHSPERGTSPCASSVWAQPSGSYPDSVCTWAQRLQDSPHEDTTGRASQDSSLGIFSFSVSHSFLMDLTQWRTSAFSLYICFLLINTTPVQVEWHYKWE